MVYLENKTELQELWIPRNDGQGVPYNPTKELEGVDVTISQDITVVHPSSGYYGMSAVTIDATEYGQQNYDSGFDDGYTDGYASGSTEGYESGYTSGYTSGSTDGYNSGYTSGETHQKSLLVSTAFTENGEYTRENGYSAITVNVPTGQTYNIEENKPFVVNRNGNYTIKPSSGITTINDRFDSDDDCYYITATTSGYPLTGKYYLFYIEDEFDDSKGQIDVYIDNGYLDYDDSDWDGGRIMDYETGDILRLKVYDANNGFGWMKDDDFYYHYDLMSAVSLTVQPIKYVEYIETDGSQIIFDTGVKVGSDDSSFEVDIDFMPLSKNNVNTFLSDEYDRFNILFRVWGDEYQTAFGNLANNADISVNNRYDVTFNYASYKGNVKCNGADVIPMQGVRLYRNSLVHSLYLNYGIAGNSPSARYYKLKITKNGVEHLFRPCLDLNNVPCFYDEYNDVYLYKTGRGTPTAGPLLPSEEYQSGYTDGQNNIINTFTAMTATTNGDYGSSSAPLSSITVNIAQTGYTQEDLEQEYDKGYGNGYDDGENNIISTFTAITATTNGVYGSSAQPLSSITVNVSQTGGSGVKYIEYLETDGTNMYVNLGTDINIKNPDEIVYFDFMPLSGNVISDGWCPFISGDMNYPYQGLGINTMWAGNDVDGSYQVKFDYVEMTLSGWSGGTKYICQLDKYGIIRNGTRYNFTSVATASTTEIETPMVINHSTNLNEGRVARARYYRFAIESGGTMLIDLRPAFDNNNIPCFYDEVTQYYYYFTNGTPTAGPVLPSPDYQSGYTSGYTDGYASGYTDGSASITSLIDRSITEIVIPSGCTKIGDSAFLRCASLSSVTIQSSVTLIGDSAFYYCTSLSSVIIPNSVTSIGSYCCSNCIALTEVNIGSGVKSIGGSSFQYCSALTDVNIGSGIKSIGTSAFRNCSALTNIYISATTAPTIYGSTFQGVPSTGTVHYPAGSDYSSWQNDSNLSGWTFVGDL